MKLVQCPEVYTADLEISIFLGGGISNCPNWQKEMIERFKHLGDDLVLLNPRRSTFNIEDPKESDFQIEWEFDHLQRCSAMIFWFPYNTLCPITLYELGLYAGFGVPLFVGCHPAYQRKFDIEKQLQLIRPDIKVHSSFEPVVEDVINWYNENR